MILANALRRVTKGGSQFASLLHTLNNPNAYNTPKDDFFGDSVAISGDYAVVGAYGEDDASGTYSGEVYVFDVVTGTRLWTLNNPNVYGSSASDYFGWSVDISGNYIVVGAYQEDASSNTQTGKAYIYEASTGVLLRTLSNPNAYGPAKDDYFGFAVAIAGTKVVVGAYGEDEPGNTTSGKAYVFDVITGNLLLTLNNPNVYGTAKTDNFGFTVAISDSYVLVSSHNEDDSGGTNSGKAYIFNLSTGALLWTLNNPNAYGTSANDQFSVNLGITDTYTVVSAYPEDDARGTNSGKAYVFNTATGTLRHILNNPNPYSTSTADNFGVSVSVSGNYVAIGAYQEDEYNGSNSGKVYIFNLVTGTLFATLNNPNKYGTLADDQFGWSVGISGSRVIVGAPQEDDSSTNTRSGKAYIFA